MEARGDWDGYEKETHKSASGKWPAPGLHQGQHVYGVEWNAESIRVFYDGQPVWTHTGPGVAHAPEHLICSAGILQFAQGNIRKAELPQRTEFDWVRAYTLRKTP